MRCHPPRVISRGTRGNGFPLLKLLRTYHGRHFEPFSGQKCTGLQDFAYTSSKIFSGGGRWYRWTPVEAPRVLGPWHQFPIGSPAFPLFLVYETTTVADISHCWHLEACAVGPLLFVWLFWIAADGPFPNLSPGYQCDTHGFGVAGEARHLFGCRHNLTFIWLNCYKSWKKHICFYYLISSAADARRLCEMHVLSLGAVDILLSLCFCHVLQQYNEWERKAVLHHTQSSGGRSCEYYRY